ncbi:PREDICTED: trihelix transcription factor GT-2 [Camelina sativa]|uniref:Trihelix transcription factor GT-2 n=1 Tax=Camelina sativa TaxID=90675 RepID=A0ABM1R4M3_CAMSA|nr:PREDICTED: trihelix transcription factor GT-2 [Camelina sativa]
MQLGGGTPSTTTTTAAASTATPPPPPPPPQPQPQSNDSAATEAAAAAAVGAFEVSEEMNDRGFGGNRWPRQETLALLKIRSDMGIAFRDASVKGPLWEEVSRKMGELGYIRNAKKCKEKFENVYKYHKRTKEGRTGKSDGKTYRFFDQLEALETHHHHHHQPLRPHQHQHQNNNSIFSTPPPITTVMPPSVPSTSIPPYTQQLNVPSSFPTDFLSDNSTSSSSSSYSTSSDMDIGGGGTTTTTTNRKKRKRKWKEFFERLMKQVVDKQEDLQRKFLEAVEKREHERLVREDSWRVQEIARINRDQEILAQERSMSAAKDAAVMAFLQKLSEKQPNQPPTTTVQPQQQVRPPQMQLLNNNNNQQQTPQPSPPAPPPLLQPIQAVLPSSSETRKTDNGDQSMMTPASASASGSASSSRWPKVEIEALIKLRTNLDSKYQENGPKGPLWEEISAGMRRLGFNRNSKRCKEKWENINKYFKKVKESNKKRPEDSKTCPYFHQLDALYRERNKLHHNNSIASSSSASGLVKPDNSVPLMVQPEQQWPPAPVTTTATTTAVAVVQQQHPQPSDQNYDDEEGTDEEDYDDEEDEEDEENEEEEERGEFELVPSNNNKTTNDL